MTRRGPLRRRSFYRFRVPLGIAGGALAVAFAEPSATSLSLGFGLALPGQALRVWAAGHIEKTVSLATGGPYSFVQHPLYLGSLLIILGCAVACAHPLVPLVGGIYVLALYPYTMRSEHEFLERRFGAEYLEWSGSVPRLVPRWSPAGPCASRFSWRRVRRNREWRSVLVFAAAAILLWAWAKR